MKLSVLVAVYNGEKYLEEQLDSIFRQTRLPEEVLVRDDASTDDSVHLIERWMEENPELAGRLRLIRNRENLGYNANFYSLMEEASGDLLFFCDQDDVWEENKIETICHIFEEHPEVLSLNTAFSVIDETGKFISGNGKSRRTEKNMEGLHKVSLESFLRYPAYPGMTMAFRSGLGKDVLIQFYGSKNKVPSAVENQNRNPEREETTGTDTSCYAAHDWAVNYKAACFGGMYYLDLPLTRYRRHGGNVSAMMRLEAGNNRKQKRLQLIEELITNLQEASDKDLRSWICFEKKRLEKLEKGSILQLIGFELASFKYTNWKPLLGDVVAACSFDENGRENKHD